MFAFSAISGESTLKFKKTFDWPACVGTTKTPRTKLPDKLRAIKKSFVSNTVFDCGFPFRDTASSCLSDARRKTLSRGGGFGIAFVKLLRIKKPNNPVHKAVQSVQTIQGRFQ